MWIVHAIIGIVHMCWFHRIRFHTPFRCRSVGWPNREQPKHSYSQTQNRIREWNTSQPAFICDFSILAFECSHKVIFWSAFYMLASVCMYWMWRICTSGVCLAFSPKTLSLSLALSPSTNQKQNENNQSNSCSHNGPILSLSPFCALSAESAAALTAACMRVCRAYTTQNNRSNQRLYGKHCEKALLVSTARKRVRWIGVVQLVEFGTLMRYNRKTRRCLKLFFFRISWIWEIWCVHFGHYFAVDKFSIPSSNRWDCWSRMTFGRWAKIIGLMKLKCFFVK